MRAARSARLGFLIPVALAVVAAYGISVLRANADERREGQVLLAEIEASANRQAELVSDVSELGVVVRDKSNLDLERKLAALPGEVEKIRDDLFEDLSELSRLSPPEDMIADFQEAARDYEDQLVRLIDMLQARDYADAWIFDRSRLEPSFDMFRDAIELADAEYSQLASGASSMAEVGTFSIVGLTVLSLALLYLELSRRDRVLMKTEQRIIADSESRFRSLVQNSSDVFIITGTDMSARYVSPSIERMLGYDPGELTGKNLTELVHAEDENALTELHKAVLADDGASAGIECRLVQRDGSLRDVELTASNSVGVPNVAGIVFNARDIAERKEAERERIELERQLEHQAFHDPLTNLANRVLFRDRVDHALRRASRTNEDLAVLFVDLDDFKQINDTTGHEAGDLLLIEVAERLRSCLRDADTIARLGGDEFAVLLEDVAEIDDVYVVGDRLLESLMMPFELNGHHVLSGGSIGVALRGSGGNSSEALLANADVAMYAAKARGKGCRETFRPDMRRDLVNRLHLEADLQKAIEAQQFVVHFQPIVEVDSGKITGAEALVRWMHPERGLVLPGEFIPLAEDTGLIVPIGRWVLERACYQAREWQLKFEQAPPLKISVNLSVRQFQRPNLVQEIAEVLQHSQLPPTSLILEITESILVQDTTAAVRKLQQLKELGVQLALDDFGTGYSSLSYLRRFPIDVLKIDKSFIDGVGTSEENSALAKAILQIGETLRLRTVAEGIEHEQQRVELESLGCKEGQGYFFARPVDAEAIDALLSGATISPTPFASKE